MDREREIERKRVLKYTRGDRFLLKEGQSMPSWFDKEIEIDSIIESREHIHYFQCPYVIKKRRDDGRVCVGYASEEFIDSHYEMTGG